MDHHAYQTLLLDLRDECWYLIVDKMNDLACEISDHNLDVSPLYQYRDTTFKWSFTVAGRGPRQLDVTFEIEEERVYVGAYAGPSIGFSAFAASHSGLPISEMGVGGPWVDIRDSEAVGSRFYWFWDNRSERYRFVQDVVNYFPQKPTVLVERQTLLQFS